MLTRLRVRGYKALRDLSVEFEPLTVIVGPNGCGKTSVLEAIEWLGEAARRPFGKDTGPDDIDVYSRGRSSEPVIRGELSARATGSDAELVAKLWKEERAATDDREKDPKSVKFRADMEKLGRDLISDGDGSTFPAIATASDELRGDLTCTPSSTSEFIHLHPQAGSPGSEQRARLLRSYFGSVRRLELNPKTLAEPSNLREAEPHVHHDGTGLATVLNWLLGEQDERFTQIEQQLRELVPEVRRIRTKRVPIQVLESADVEIGTDEYGRPIFEKRPYKREETGHRVVIDYEHADDVPAHHASEGTLLLLGLLTVIATTRASVLLLDDIERGLHPKSQQQLIGYLQQITKDGPQIIATSHSPYLLLHLEYEQVRAMTLAGARGSLVGKLSEHPEFERWKEEFSPSEFWTVFGESWLETRGADG